jgi:UDP-N-acetylglucosamine--N-acetylmuramyl-(pentapeptide) pyrophosphoryl-undecaprenol N-acetylglucosamine transferase
VGNPIRQTGPTAPNGSEQESSGAPLARPDDFTLLVTGGSQGAASINQAFFQAVELIVKSGNEMMDQVHIIHQTGQNDEAPLKKAYENLGIRATVKAFFQNMPALQDKADLVITRAGAGTISEIAVKGLPAILVPFPHAADDHQTFNAKILADQGAAILIADRDLTGPRLKKTLLNLIKDKNKLKQMGIAAKQLAMPDADKIIAGAILNTKDL